MDISDLLKQGNMGNISPEKLNFLMQFANQNHSGNAKEMASELSQAASCLLYTSDAADEL